MTRGFGFGLARAPRAADGPNRRAQLSEKSLALKAQIKHLEREAEAHAALHAGDRASAEDLAQARGAH